MLHLVLVEFFAHLLVEIKQLPCWTLLKFSLAYAGRADNTRLTQLELWMRANEEPVQIIGSLGSIFIKLFRCQIPSNSLNRNTYCLCNLGILLVTAGSVPRFSSQFDLWPWCLVVMACTGGQLTPFDIPFHYLAAHIWDYCLKVSMIRIFFRWCHWRAFQRQIVWWLVACHLNDLWK